MGLLQDAMAKAGLVSQEEADAADSVTANESAQDNHEAHSRQSQSTDTHTIPRSGVFHGVDGEDNSVLLAKFDELFNNNHSRKFMNHLIFAFTPFSVVRTLEEWSPEQYKNKRCCICNVLVVSREDLLRVTPQMADASIDRLRSIATGVEPKSMQQIIQEIFHETAYIGSCSPDSKSLFCPKCVRAFFHWIELQLLSCNNSVGNIISKKRLHYIARE